MIWFNGALALLSLLAVFKAPAKPLWFLAILMTEGAHFLAPVALFLALWSWKHASYPKTAFAFALIATLFFISPLWRAARVARRLPEEFSNVFGSIPPRETPQASARAQPLRLADLVKGISSPEVQHITEVYGAPAGRPLSVDLYRPTPWNGELLPGVIVVHGGSWQSGGRGELNGLNRYLAARGYVVASLDYRLAPDVLFPGPRDDVFMAIDYLKRHAHRLGWDPNRVAVLGRSAGGQVALSAAYAKKDPALKGVIVFYAPNDLIWGYSIPANPLIMNSRKVIETYLGGKPQDVFPTYEAASPLRWVTAETPPTLMIHGLRDELVSPEHEERLGRKLKENGRPFFYLRLPWATHGCDAIFSGPSGQLSTYVIERFLATVLPPAMDSRPPEVAVGSAKS